ncbi:MAG: putative toxin-antitoxin system toxin component, PIN family [Planctomycetes bacterium]|nr:putative toxin-antitoxin system toxin component, PIN family [Planctomycetota bacterium]
MRIVPDANVVISAFFFSGVPMRFLCKAFEDGHVLITSNAILSEIRSTMNKPFFRKRIDRQDHPEQILADYRRMATTIDPVAIPSVCRDPNDNMVLACAAEAGAEAIVTGDKDLQVMGRYGLVEIWSPAVALTRISEDTWNGAR